MNILQKLLSVQPSTSSFQEGMRELAGKNADTLVVHGGAALSIVSFAVAALFNQKFWIGTGSGALGFVGGYYIRKFLGKKPLSIKLLSGILRLEDTVPRVRKMAALAAIISLCVMPVAPMGLIWLGCGLYEGFRYSPVTQTAS